MAGNAFRKNIWREIMHSFGRYLAILSIIALGVGFFAGLQITEKAMLATGDKYVSKANMYDYQLISTVGIDKSDVETFEKLDFVNCAEGSYSFDAVCTLSTVKNELVFKVHSYSGKINVPSLVVGRLPSSDNECVIDDDMRLQHNNDVSVLLGAKLTVCDSNDQGTLDYLSAKEFTVVGVVSSATYMSMERGTTKIGSGSVDGFVYLPIGCFQADYYTELFIDADVDGAVFTEKYDNGVDALRDKVAEKIEECAKRRYDGIVDEAVSMLESKRKQFDVLHDTVMFPYKQRLDYLGSLKERYSDFYFVKIIDSKIEIAQDLYDSVEKEFFADSQKQIEDAEAQIEELKNTDVATYVLTRNENIGYVSFANDADVVDGIAKILPVFFFTVAALICITTMTRMVADQRTQIGTLKAIGYTDAAIVWKYVFYAGSAALIGSVSGYFIGTFLFPRAIWSAYVVLYGFADLSFVFDIGLFSISVVASLLCSAGTTLIVCLRELLNMPSTLMRPKTPSAGKRILLERIPFLWNRLGFLGKVSLRNIFRYKKRLFMMILGVGGCTALLLTGFGIRDSICNLAEFHFDQIALYDYSIIFSDEKTSEEVNAFKNEFGDVIDTAAFVFETSTYADTNEGVKEVVVIATNDLNIEKLFDLHDGAYNHIAYPGKNEVVLSEKIASQMGANVGDTVYLRVDETGKEKMELKLVGISKSYFMSYAYMTADTYESATGESAPYKNAYMSVKDGVDIDDTSTRLMNYGGILNVTATQTIRDAVTDTMSIMNYIVILVILCAAALSFIVLINLSNINITERQREIATIKVLGFYPRETSSYVFRENLILTVVGAIVGLPIGILLHSFVMNQLQLDLVAFDTVIMGWSYLYAFVLTVVFTIIVDLLMRPKLHKINMAESLKSVE